MRYKNGIRSPAIGWHVADTVIKSRTEIPQYMLHFKSTYFVSVALHQQYKQCLR